MSLTPKQEKFARAYVETVNASEAYRLAYDAERMKPETVNKRASELLTSGAITGRIGELQAEHRKQHDITVERITAMYLEDRELAHQLGNPSAAVSATTGLARLYGLDKQVHHVRNNPIQELLDEIAGTTLGPPSERKKH